MVKKLVVAAISLLVAKGIDNKKKGKTLLGKTPASIEATTDASIPLALDKNDYSIK